MTNQELQEAIKYLMEYNIHNKESEDAKKALSALLTVQVSRAALNQGKIDTLGPSMSDTSEYQKQVAKLQDAIASKKFDGWWR